MMGGQAIRGSAYSLEPLTAGLSQRRHRQPPLLYRSKAWVGPVRYQGPSQELDQIWAEAVFLWTVAGEPCLTREQEAIASQDGALEV